MLNQFVVVLHQPQDVRNIGAVVRAMKNMGFCRLRLVNPTPFEPADLLGIAHRADDLVAAIEYFSSLPAALADTRYVVGLSERPRLDRPCRGDLRPLAAELLARADAGPVALLFGPEDNGLDLAALDRCSLLLSLPTDPAYPSLNLAQAVLLVLYELRAASGVPLPLATPRRPPASAGEVEALFATVATALEAVAFVKSGDGAATLRRLRTLLARAEPDSAEAALLTAMAREVVHALRRARQQ